MVKPVFLAESANMKAPATAVDIGVETALNAAYAAERCFIDLISR